MSQGFLRQADDGRLYLSGVLDYTTGVALREQGRKLVSAAQTNELHVDCSGVERSSSVGLSLLLCLLRDARREGKTLTLSGLPEDMRQIAGVGDLLDILPLQDVSDPV